MKTQKMIRITRNIVLGIFVLMLAVPLTANAKKAVFLNSSVVPSATGYAKVTNDNNKNSVIKVKVSDLAAIERLQSSNITYVVWMETDQGRVENLGQLKSTTSLFSKRHKASLQTISSYKPVKIFVTSENDINVQYPGSQVVLTTDSF